MKVASLPLHAILVWWPVQSSNSFTEQHFPKGQTEELIVFTSRVQFSALGYRGQALFQILCPGIALPHSAIIFNALRCILKIPSLAQNNMILNTLHLSFNTRKYLF